jgi:glycosyltransferase involved in cell wall biosynthesis
MGLDNLLRCIYLLKNKGIDLHLTVGGEGTETKNLGNLIDEYGLAKMVTMTGFIPSELLPQYYGAADFFILPTRKLEGFGLVTPESMACGTPVLGTPVGGTKEILSGLDPKLLFRNPSPEAMAEGIQRAIGKYYNYETKYMKLRLLCREYASTNYAWHPHIDRLMSIIDEVGSIRNSPKDVAPKKCLHA